MQNIATVSMPVRKPNHGLTMVSTLIASRWSRPQSQIHSSLCSLILTLCEPFSLFHQIIDSLCLCDNVLHKLEILFSSLTNLCFKRNPAESRTLFGAITHLSHR